MGGSAPYKKGAAHENLVLRAYVEAGWPVVVRSPGSSSEYDVLAVRFEPIKTSADLRAVYPAVHEVHLVQCKMDGYMRPAERESLKEVARSIGAVPVLAWGGDARKKTGPIHRKDIRTGRDLGDLEIGADGTTDGAVSSVGTPEGLRD